MSHSLSLSSPSHFLVVCCALSSPLCQNSVRQGCWWPPPCHVQGSILRHHFARPLSSVWHRRSLLPSRYNVFTWHLGHHPLKLVSSAPSPSLATPPSLFNHYYLGWTRNSPGPPSLSFLYSAPWWSHSISYHQTPSNFYLSSLQLSLRAPDLCTELFSPFSSQMFNRFSKWSASKTKPLIPSLHCFTTYYSPTLLGLSKEHQQTPIFSGEEPRSDSWFCFPPHSTYRHILTFLPSKR